MKFGVKYHEPNHMDNLGDRTLAVSLFTSFNPRI